MNQSRPCFLALAPCRSQGGPVHTSFFFARAMWKYPLVANYCRGCLSRARGGTRTPDTHIPPRSPSRATRKTSQFTSERAQARESCVLRTFGRECIGLANHEVRAYALSVHGRRPLCATRPCDSPSPLGSARQCGTPNPGGDASALVRGEEGTWLAPPGSGSRLLPGCTVPTLTAELDRPAVGGCASMPKLKCD